MYTDNYGNINLADEITCPYCNEEFMDSWEYIPSDGDGEKSWDQECPECGKKFRVSFDIYNQSDGFECSKICKRHDYRWDGQDKYEDHDLKYYISRTSNVYRCRKCGEIKFVNTKSDGTEYTKAELKEWRKKRDRENFVKNHPYCNKHDGPKKIEISTRDTKIGIKTEVPEGNEDLFRSVNNFLKKRGFSVSSEKDEHRSLKRYNKYLRRGWLECSSEFYRTGMEWKFFQNLNIENKNGGQYDFDKYEKLTVKQKCEFRAVRKAIVKFLGEKCIVIEKESEIFDSHGYVDSPGKTDPKHPGRVVAEYSQKDFDSKYRENLDRDGIPIHNGDLVGHYDDHGRLWKGRIYNRCGSYKYLVHNDRNVSYAAPYECFRLTGNEPRKTLPKRSVSVLKGLLAEAVKAQNFEKAIVYRDRLKELEERG